jgi:hypothetical protein
MPYIKAHRRKQFAKLIEAASSVSTRTTSAELDFVFTMLCRRFLGFTPDFDRMNSLTGVLDNVKDEFRRRRLHPYEDRKRKENGDTW